MRVKVYPLPEPPVAVNCWLKSSPTVATHRLGLTTRAAFTVRV